MKMIAELMPFNKAMDVARSNGYLTRLHQICGLTEADVPWGEKIMVECNNLDEKYYTFHHYDIPSCCFEINSNPTSLDSVFVLRYGTIITDDQLYGTDNEKGSCVRIMIVDCYDSIYYIKIVNSETVEFKRIGRANNET